MATHVGPREPSGSERVLHVVVPYMNPQHFSRRQQLFREFMSRLASLEREGDAGGSRIIVYVVEAVVGHDADYEVTEPDNPRHLRVHARHAMWLKEQLVNCAVARLLPRDWRSLAWIDADITFLNPAWVTETLEALEHHPFVQMFERAQDLGPRGEPINNRESFASRFQRSLLEGVKVSQNTAGKKRKAVHITDLHAPAAAAVASSTRSKSSSASSTAAAAPRAYESCAYSGANQSSQQLDESLESGNFSTGYAWAATHAAWDATGGLIDVCIMGSADWHMGYGLCGIVDASIATGTLSEESCSDLHPNYVGAVRAWADNANAALGKHCLGFVKGTVAHHWHGAKSKRGYNWRSEILALHGFDPQRHLVRNKYGVYEFSPIAPHHLRAQVNAYFSTRDENSTAACGCEER